jgi:phosphoribosylformylglycinamidine synthase
MPEALEHRYGKIILNRPGLSRVNTRANQVFVVEVVISNKAAAKDPEGDVIHRDLVKSHFPQAKSVRVGKLLRFKVEAADSLEAKKLVQRMCDELRIYNPAAHDCQIALGRLSP